MTRIFYDLSAIFPILSFFFLLIMEEFSSKTHINARVAFGLSKGVHPQIRLQRITTGKGKLFALFVRLQRVLVQIRPQEPRVRVVLHEVEDLLLRLSKQKEEIGQELAMTGIRASNLL